MLCRSLQYSSYSKSYERMASGPQQRDRAILKLNIEAGILSAPTHAQFFTTITLFSQDLYNLFDWNTKQLFVMLMAHYKTKRNVKFRWTL